MKRDQPGKRKADFLWIAIILVLATVLGVVFTPRFIRNGGRGSLTPCKSNLKNIGTACEMYSTDDPCHHYPPSGKLFLLTPNYLRTLPTCAAAGKDTYSATYRSNTKPDAYTFYCSGYHHKSGGEAPNYPQYNSTQGLVT